MEGREPENETLEVDVPEDTEEQAEVSGEESTVSEADTSDESVRDTVKRAFEELAAPEKSAGPGGETPEAGEVAEEKLQAPQAKEFDPETVPPARFSAQEKEFFARLPKGIKKGLNRMVREHEGQMTRALQEYSNGVQQVRGIMEAVQPYAAQWGERGFTVPSAIAALAAANQKLSNPETAVSEWLKLGKDIGIDTSAFEGQEAQNGHVPDISQHPQFQALQQELNQVKSLTGSWQQQQFQATVSDIVSELEAVRDEVDGSGHYRYPKLHDPAFLETVKPLVLALRGTVPNMTYGEAMKRAYYSIEGQAGTSSQLTQPSLPASPQTQQRALNAAVSVRGRVAQPNTNAMAVPENVPNSVRDTVRMAYEQLARG